MQMLKSMTVIVFVVGFFFSETWAASIVGKGVLENLHSLNAAFAIFSALVGISFWLANIMIEKYFFRSRTA